jgi:ribonuclease D
MIARLPTLDDAPELCRALAGASRVTVDTEFHAERRWLPTLYLVQLGLDDGTVWIVDPLIDGLVAAIAGPLRQTPWIVHGGHQDLRLLHSALGGILPERILDTQIGAGLVEADFPAPLQRLTERWIDHPLAKTATLSDWSTRPLSAEQIRYATDDARILLPLWDAIADELERTGRMALAEQACAEARARVTDPPGVDQAWRELAAVPALSAHQLCVLQELAAWREQIARSRNQPTRSILGDGSLVDLARRQPTTVDAMLASRRLPRTVRKHADELLELITRAAARPEWAWPRAVARGSEAHRTASFLHAWALAAGHAGRWAPRLVMPSTVLDDLALDLPASRVDLATRIGPWRDQLIGDDLWAVLDGSQGLALDGRVVLRAQNRE